MAQVQKSMDSSSLAEVVDRILDKGIVSTPGCASLWSASSSWPLEASGSFVASVETYLRYAEAVGLTAAAEA